MPADVAAVAGVVHRVAVVVGEVVPVHVVDVAVAVVVLVVARDLVFVDPHVGGQLGMRVVDAGVADRDHDLGRAGAGVPGLRRVDLRHAPQLGVAGVVGGCPGLHDVVALRLHHRARADELRDREVGGGRRRKLDAAVTELRQRSRLRDHAATDHRQRVLQYRRRDVGRHAHDDLVRQVLRAVTGVHDLRRRRCPAHAGMAAGRRERRDNHGGQRPETERTENGRVNAEHYE